MLVTVVSHKRDNITLKKMNFNFCSLTDLALNGEPSLQNTLELAGRVLRPLPGHASREILVLFASLTTCDPTDINTTIQVRFLFHFFYVQIKETQ